MKKRKVVRKKFSAKPAPETPPPPPSGPAAKLFDVLSYAGLPLLIVLAAAMTFLEVWQVRDLWRQQDLGVFAGQFSASVPAHGVVLVKM